jgi:uncharacterized protein YhaN
LELKQAHAEIATLENKVEGLEGKVKTLKEREKEAKSELDGWLRDEKGKEGSVSLRLVQTVLSIDCIRRRRRPTS